MALEYVMSFNASNMVNEDDILYTLACGLTQMHLDFVASLLESHKLTL